MKRNLAIALILSLGISGLSGFAVRAEENEVPVMQQEAESPFTEVQPESLEVSEQEIQESGREGEKTGHWVLNASGWWYAYEDGTWPSDGKKVIGKDTYFFAVSGAMHTGWVLRPEGWYYLGGDGVMKTGWQLVGGAWYYLDGENLEYPGLMTGTGWHLIQGQKYYMTGSGAMATDWLPSSEGWYYLGGDGAMKTGWQWIDNHWYYFYTENDPLGGTTGVMAVNTMVDGWTITSNGIAVNGLEGKFEEIKKYVYVPYRYGGTTPSGWDCSGFTQWALHYIGGITIPRTTYLQAVGGVNIDKNNRNLWKPGDILVYQSGSGFSHVALYLGDGMLMHALNTKYGTLIQGVDYYEQWDRGNHLALVRRYL